MMASHCGLAQGIAHEVTIPMSGLPLLSLSFSLAHDDHGCPHSP